MNLQDLRSQAATWSVRDRLILIGELIRSLFLAWPSVPNATKKRPVILSADESRLLLAINQAISVELQERYHYLLIQRDANALTSEEYSELITLGDRIENLEAERLGNLLQLAQLRQTSLDQLMIDLGLLQLPTVIE
ncbi:hypothetical protein H6G51_08950 [Limnothrix sp. FACHB-708]|uniref:hypothetical protein n=1 Tax=unclassified Limnothrix TaxID=2632864 RepID=UPI0016897168|nr:MULTISPECIES: hypothetical protein [unclassified Limnothrix]MBD2553402.1 hypothetical protein [Limnothrix sp. FACHB-708]MBD2590442.1 hypothetical protein [Limnothrix sp. FACHB-406]